jgi:Tol biopolymer transport system component
MPTGGRVGPVWGGFWGASNRVIYSGCMTCVSATHSNATVNLSFLSQSSFSRFDVTVVAVLLTCALILGMLGWRMAGSSPADALSFLYITSDELGRSQLHYARLAEDGQVAQTRQLSSSESGIWDFALTPGGDAVVFAALGELGMSDLWKVSLPVRELSQLLACPNASCSNARFSPDGRLVAITWRNMSEFSSAFFSPPRLWLLDSLSGEMAPLFSDSQQLSFDPRWSPDGRWLSYISPEPNGLGVINLEDGRTALYPDAMGEAGTWTPAGDAILTTNTWSQGQEYVIHILQINVETGETVDLSGDESLVHDSNPSYSPDGEWIAFRRKVLTGPQATRGKQIWRMRADGSAAEPLTHDPEYDHGNPDWSPDGRYLLTRRFPLKGPEVIPSVWLIEVESGRTWQLVEPGDQPTWIKGG